MEDGQSASPEEQAAYEQFVGAAMDIIYPKGESGQVSPQIVDDLKGNIDPEARKLFEAAEPPLSGAPQDNTAAVTVVLVLLVDSQLGFLAKAREAAASGGPAIEYDTVVFHAAQAIAEDLVEVAEAAGIHEFSEDDLAGVWARAMDLYRVASETMGAPGYDKEGLSNAFLDLLEADKTGNLGSILPGLPGGAPMNRQAG